MANTNPRIQDKAITLKVNSEFLDALDRVRRLEKPHRTKSDAIRKLVFEADRKSKMARA